MLVIVDINISNVVFTLTVLTVLRKFAELVSNNQKKLFY